ncbi:MAG: FtsX-like permease family protein [Eggerthellaceae bacterium]|nr:FtsX-like permease family protein [Eggerthellaceae bacterium]
MSAFAKELLRSITRKPGRFLALLAIVALGAGFYAGLRMTAPDMGLALDDYFDEGRVYDVRVVSTMGFDEADLDAIAELPSIEQVMGARQTDVLADLGGASYTVRIHSCPEGAEGGLNRIELYEGRMPETTGECVIAGDRVMAKDAEIGDAVDVTQATGAIDDALSVRHLTIVGQVHTPYYVSSAAIEASSLGSGVVQQVLYVPRDTFAADFPLTDAFATVRGAAAAYYQGAEYDSLVDEAKSQLESIADERCRARYDSLQAQMRDRATTWRGLLDLLEYRLSATQDELDNPTLPEWLVMGRDKNAGTSSYTADAARVDHIAQVFPTVFFLVAALVALTTMTRMVEDERQLIGTYKALGYTRRRITGKYLAYAALASGIGSIVGIAVLGVLLPYVIMNAYAIMYYAPPGAPPLDLGIAALSTLLSMGITLVATWFSVAATLRERPASLMLPRAPKPGRRILLERVRPLWSRLSFSWKVTARNLFRYKKRLVMTVIGIAGCTALLLTGLGLHDAINDIIDIQYGEIIHNNVVIAIDDDARDEERAALDGVLAREDLVHSSTKLFSETMLASGPRASDKRVDVVVPHDPQAFSQMKTLRTRFDHEPLEIPDGSALVNEKLAQELGLKVGDEIEVSHQDAMGNAESDVYRVQIGALYENYIYNYLYLSDEAYERSFGQMPSENAVYADVTTDKAKRAELDRLLDETRCIRTVAYNDETIDTYRTMLRSVDLIVVVLVVAAAALAFIVLYNLTNINIEERIREIATLKVLGFTRREAHAYIFREVVLLSIIGCAIGLALGLPLESFVVTTAEVDQVMFGRAIHAPSFVLAFALTLVFSALSMLLMFPKFARIDMVESLKSNE